MTTVGPISVVKCGQSVNLCANFASDASPNRIIWWYTSAPTKVPRSHSPAKSAESTSSVKTTYVSTGKYHSRFFTHLSLFLFPFVVSQLITSNNFLTRLTSMFSVRFLKPPKMRFLCPSTTTDTEIPRKAAFHRKYHNYSRVNICPTCLTLQNIIYHFMCC